MGVISWFDKLNTVGTSQVKDPEAAKQIRLTNLMALTVFTTGSPFSVIFYIYGSRTSGIVLSFYILSFLLVYFFNYKNQHLAAKIFMLSIMNIAVIHLAFWYGADSALHRMLIPFGCIPFLIFNRNHVILIGTFVTISLCGYLTIDFLTFEPLLILDDLSMSIVYHGITLIAWTWIILEMLYLSNQNFLATSGLSQQRKDQTSAIVHAQELERRRMARDLHDSFGQLLSAIKVNLEMVPEPSNKHLTISKELIDNAVVEMRNIAFNLMPSTLENKGLTYALAELISKIKETTKFEFYYYAQNVQLQNITKDQQYNIYRIVQEGLHNIIKHSNATEVSLQLVNFDKTLTITLEDNGKGFNVKDTNASGSGLQNMRARTEWLDGVFTIDSGTEIGTTIIVSIPVKNISEKL